jgi:hypothetical protein
MKKLLSLLFILTLLTLACGLGGNTTTPDESPAAPAVSQAEAEPTSPPAPTPKPTDTPAPTEPPPAPTEEANVTSQDSLSVEIDTEPTTEPAVEVVGVVTLPGGGQAVPGNSADVTQEGGAAGIAYQPNVAFILDGSGSMNADLPEAGQPKLAVAKQALTALTANVPPEINGALWIYGHRYPQEPKAESCKDIEQVFPLGQVDGPAYAQTVRAITAIGYTPIADSMQLAAEAMPVGETQVNSLILVSDGEESCGGDPCALAAALKQSEADITIHVIGYDVDDPTRVQLQCIADVSGGMYRDAADADSLLAALSDSLEIAQTDTVLRLELFGPDGEGIDGRADFYQAGTDIYVGGASAWQDRTIAPGQYDVVIDTQPPVIYPNLQIVEGSTTVIRMTLGAFDLIDYNGEPTRPEIFLFDGTGTVELGWYGANSDLSRYYTPAGTYRIGVRDGGLSQPLAIEAGQTTPLTLGALNLLRDGQPVRPEFWIYDQSTGEKVGWYGANDDAELFFVVPGEYKIVVRDGGVVNNVVINGGELAEVALGALEVVSVGSQPVRPELWFYDGASGNEVGWYGNDSPDGLYLMAPGLYWVRLRNGGQFEAVRVEVDAVTTLELGELAFDLSQWTEPDTNPEFKAFHQSDDTEVSWYGRNSNGPFYFVPDTYRLEIKGGPTIADVAINPQEETVVKVIAP